MSTKGKVPDAASASIKGGGRVALTSDLEDAIVDLLWKRRDPKRPLVSRSKSFSDDGDQGSVSSDHDDAHRRRTFLKRLVTDHERHVLSLRLNQVSLRSEESTQVLSNSKDSKQTMSKPNTPGGKVRLELVEAMYKCQEKWNAGPTRKTVVFERSTAIDAVLKQAKEKLKLKKKAVRCFYVDRKHEIDLTKNLEGVEDGSILYVSTHQPTPKKEIIIDEQNDDSFPDPLLMVKQVYASRTRVFRCRAPLSLRQSSGHVRELPPLPEFRAQLPAANFRSEILSALDQSRVVIICGATGCGKSTQIPQYILDEMQAAGYDGNIVVTQPRRVAATTLAQRVAFERQEKVGSSVGYQVRLDAAVSNSTRITFMTIGILLRRLTMSFDVKEAPLSDISHLVIDEIHERDINTDFCLAILQSVLVRNPLVKIILMSATTTPDLFVRYFRSDLLGIEPAVLTIPGRSFQVDTFWLDDVEKTIGKQLHGWSEEVELPTKESLSPRAAVAIDNSFLSSLVFHLAQTSPSDVAVLIFLPGRAEIESLVRTLIKDDNNEPGLLDIHTLHSSVSQAVQKAAFQPARGGKVKVVLATNVAETSITIPDVCIVIDTGRVKESRYNSEARMKELVTVWTSQASVAQRAGRAGRTRQGSCYCLYTKTFAQKHMLERTTPEILRTPLEELILQCCLLYENRMDRADEKSNASSARMGLAPVSLLSKTPDPPPDENVTHACLHLLEIGALHLVSGEGEHMRVRLTPLGYHLSQLPLDAKIGKILVVGCMLGCVEPALTIAASLSSSKSAFWSNAREKQEALIESGFGGVDWGGGTVKGDSIAFVAIYDRWSSHTNDHLRFRFAKDNGIDHNVLSDICNLREQFRACLIDAGLIVSKEDVGSHSGDALLTSCCLAAGLYPNVARLMRPVRGKGGYNCGRLLTKDGDMCTPGNGSFQGRRVRKASETGRDVYAVYHSKHQTTGATMEATTRQKLKVFLSDVNFISRFALLLFGGNLEVKENVILVDKWLKFKVGDRGRITAVLLTEFRQELDTVLLDRLSGRSAEGSDEVIKMVVRLLKDE
ncbi:helicase [Fragilaria crotonensis]|nr:helicase [Fragilaria crotonensis]